MKEDHHLPRDKCGYSSHIREHFPYYQERLASYKKLGKKLPLDQRGNSLVGIGVGQLQNISGPTCNARRIVSITNRPGASKPHNTILNGPRKKLTRYYRVGVITSTEVYKG